LRPGLTQDALAAESDILLEELRALEKDADFVLERMFLRSLWKGHGLCRAPRGRLLTIKGTTKLESFKHTKLQSFHKQSHHPEALTVVAAGDVRHDAIEKLADGLFGTLEPPKKTVPTISPNAHRFLALRSRAQFSKVRFEIGFPACAASDNQRHEAALLNAAIAGSPGARLPLLASESDLPALSISSRLQMFEDVGCLSIRGRAGRKEAEQVIQRVVAELWRIADTELDEDELERACATRKAALLDEVASLPKRVAGLARAERYFKRLAPLEDEFTALENVTPKELQRLASLWITPYLLSMAVLGSVTGLDIGGHLLKRH
jgi:predicted Zn-dependent peptidase